MEKESAGGRAGVDGVGQTLELNPLLLKLSDQIDKLLDAPPQPIQFPNDEGVSVAEVLSGLS